MFVEVVGSEAMYRVHVENPTSCGGAELIADSYGTFYLTEDSPSYLSNLSLNGLAYPDLLEEAHWSPGENEIAVRLYLEETDIGVVAVADLDSGRTSTELLPIYAAPGRLIHDLAWNSTGTELAVVESPSDDWDAKQLLIIDRSAGSMVAGPWTPQQVGIPSDNAFVFPDWARTTGSRRIASQAYFDPSGGSKPAWWIVIVDFADQNPQMETVVSGWSPSWSPDDEHLVFGMPKNRFTKIVKRVEVATGIVTPLGGSYTGGGSPSTDWSRAVPQLGFCGDGNCEGAEDECNCPSDCGSPPPSELLSSGECADTIDNDCDGAIDCDDTDDCSEADNCLGGQPGDPCATGAECISGLCHPKKLVCK